MKPLHTLNTIYLTENEKLIILRARQMYHGMSYTFRKVGIQLVIITHSAGIVPFTNLEEWIISAKKARVNIQDYRDELLSIPT